MIRIYVVKFAVYQDHTKTNFKVKKEFSGSIIKIAEQLLDYSDLFNDVGAEIVDYQPERVEIISYPRIALREGIMNAISHTDYSLSSNIKIEFFVNRMMITSPGCILEG